MTADRGPGSEVGGRETEVRGQMSEDRRQETGGAVRTYNIEWPTLQSQTFEKYLDDAGEGRIVDGRRIPNDGILGSKVAVGEDVSKAGDGTPWDFREWVGEIGGKVFHGPLQ